MIQKQKLRQYFKVFEFKVITRKYYWSLLKTKLNDKITPTVPPIIHDNNFVTDFSEKADLVNSVLAKQ